jgi:hypothetical protein
MRSAEDQLANLKTLLKHTLRHKGDFFDAQAERLSKEIKELQEKIAPKRGKSSRVLKTPKVRKNLASRRGHA